MAVSCLLSVVSAEKYLPWHYRTPGENLEAITSILIPVTHLIMYSTSRKYANV